jgi:hypothetical protein
MGDIRSIMPYGPRFGTDRVRVLPVLVTAACVLVACSSSAVGDVAASLTASASPTKSVVASPQPMQDPAIGIETPRDGVEVGSPVSVTGTAEVLGGQVTVRVLDENGSELAAANVEVRCRKECPGTFATELFFFVQDQEPGWIEVSGDAEAGRAAISTVSVVLFPA